MRSRVKEREKIRRKEKRKLTRGRRIKMVVIALIVITLFLIWGNFIESNMLVIHDYKIESERLKPSFNGLKIVHFSDLHYGTTKERNLKKLVNNINSLKPDIVIFTGDLMEENYEFNDKDIKLLTSYLNKINAKLGKYAIMGNHDVKNEHYENILYDSRFVLLKNNYDIVYNEKSDAIAIYGLDDYLLGTPKIANMKTKELNTISYKIVVLHESDYVDEFVNDYDSALILSGHSHGGQVRIPLVMRLFLPKGGRKYYKSYYELNGTPMYVSNGVGASSVNFRFLSTPSINVYRLYSK